MANKTMSLELVIDNILDFCTKFEDDVSRGDMWLNAECEPVQHGLGTISNPTTSPEILFRKKLISEEIYNLIKDGNHELFWKDGEIRVREIEN